MKARQRHTPGQMNNLERKYAAHLDTLKLAGDIKYWRFEELTLKLADGCRYTPDFWVVMPDETVEIHESKGFWRDDARTKIKCAAAKFHEFVFRGVQWSKKDGWTYERFGA